MAACRALLKASGLLKEGTASSHATSSSQSGSTATEHASLLLETGSGSTATEHASLERLRQMSKSRLQTAAYEENFFLEDKDLEKIIALLLWMSQDFQPDFHTDRIHNAALDVVIKQSKDKMHTLHTASVTKLSQLIDTMMLNKDGSPKDPNITLAFMRRIAAVREEVLQGNSDPDVESDDATERVELDQDQVGKCYQLFGCNFLKKDLLPHQISDFRYCLRNKFEGDTYLSTFQRSFIDNMLRKSLGDKRVALLIWQHGLPSIADSPLALGQRPRTVVRRMAQLKSRLDQCLQWYIELANNIVIHQTQEGMDAQRAASSKDEQERQQQQKRRQALRLAQSQLRLGEALARQRDKCKRKFEDMDEDEQQILQDYDTGRAERAKEEVSYATRLKPFRCQPGSTLS